jgi:mono/diheme cytochrome c family protein
MDWDWMSRYRGSGQAEPADPADETVINGAPYDARKAIRSPQNPAVPGDRSEAVAEEIRRQQLSAVVRYVAAMRAR